VKHCNPEEDLTVFMIRQLAQIERALNLIKLGGIFILLIVFCDYLTDLGWLDSKMQTFRP
jgi:hypothetical protein